MNLLPNNSTKRDQTFASFLDRRAKADYSDINTNPLLCDASLLPHIAILKNANIENMLELEVREYLSTFDKKLLGTIGAVEDTANVFFRNVKVVEWFEDESLAVGEFYVEVSAEENKDVYDLRTFETARKFLKRSKNVRSKLKELKLSYLTEIPLNVATGAVAEISSSTKSATGYKETLKGSNVVICSNTAELKSYAHMQGYEETLTGVQTIQNIGAVGELTATAYQI